MLISIFCDFDLLEERIPGILIDVEKRRASAATAAAAA